jgi:hypothetical protein
MVGSYPPITAPALVIVGAMMLPYILAFVLLVLFCFRAHQNGLESQKEVGDCAQHPEKTFRRAR